MDSGTSTDGCPRPIFGTVSSQDPSARRCIGKVSGHADRMAVARVGGELVSRADPCQAGKVQIDPRESGRVGRLKARIFRNSDELSTNSQRSGTGNLFARTGNRFRRFRSTRSARSASEPATRAGLPASTAGVFRTRARPSGILSVARSSECFGFGSRVAARQDDQRLLEQRLRIGIPEGRDSVLPIEVTRRIIRAP